MSNKNYTPVKLRGVLGGKFGATTRYLDVSSPGEALQACCATIPGFEDFSRNMTVRILVEDAPVSLDDIGKSTGRQEIRIVPVVHGAKSGPFEFLVGAALTVVGVYFHIQPLVGIGISMMLGGVSLMMSTPPNSSSSKNSFLFSNASNPVAQGVPVPILYGEMTIVPPLISAGIDTEAFTSTLLSTAGALYDGLGNWVGNGDTAPWGASLTAT